MKEYAYKLMNPFRVGRGRLDVYIAILGLAKEGLEIDSLPKEVAQSIEIRDDSADHTSFYVRARSKMEADGLMRKFREEYEKAAEKSVRPTPFLPGSRRRRLATAGSLKVEYDRRVAKTNGLSSQR